MRQAFGPADILLPKENVKMETWSVIACDQYTSEPNYWRNVEKLVGRRPSAYHLILPEAYLGQVDVEQTWMDIEAEMDRYMKGFLKTYKNAMIYVERTMRDGRVQPGLVGCIDLEEYDYHKGSESMLRATEATVEERLPSRIAIREHAPLELPHILVLIDDEKNTVIEPLKKASEYQERLYDFDLMMEGGHLRGWLLGENEQRRVLNALNHLAREDVFHEKYGSDAGAVMEYAVGDGNHSLAAAKAYYEELKAQNPGKDLSYHPARYALVELENLHSPTLKFEPIHRIVKHVNVNQLLKEMKDELGIVDNTKWLEPEKEQQVVYSVIKGKKEKLIITEPTSKLTVGTLQNFLDDYLEHNKGEIDYVHGNSTLYNLSKEPDSIGFLLPPMPKEKLFPTVIFEGALPRKTFSIGNAQDKRYYTEARKIVE